MSLEKLEKMCAELETKQKEIQGGLKKDFNSGSVYLDCGLLDDMEHLIVIKAKIELLTELINDFEEE